ncbi:hypothetical protein F511_43306 [Dorcoceras hygrometricum]|uniref:Dystroglycan-like n=1 Tax=Dorcoceras hygrometricum TaxID=472368 RepID=A0A2Z7CMF1_9LAMI|nr:hypothetical protein F511_43306 [Dorcoceras hygrometricum]
MAASFYSNSVHVDFDSVLEMDEPGMVSMFQALVASGLQGFLGCPAVVYEEALVEFFANGTVRDGLVVSSVNGVFIEISEELFADTFELPVYGLGDLSEIPKDAIFDGRSIVSLSGEQISLSGRKNQMKFEFRLLCDIMVKAISVKAGLMTKRWADVCLAVVEFCASQRLIPVGSLQFCRSLQLVEPVSRIAPSRSPVFAFRVSQFCSIFVDFSLFNWFPSADISEFLSSVSLDRTVLRSVQSSQNSVSVVPSVQLSLDQHQSSSSSTDSSSLHFDQTDVDATASSLPPASQDLSAVLADLQATLSEQFFEYQSDLSSKLHKIEQSVCDSLRDQADIFRNLSQGARQEARTLDDVQTLRFNDFRKHFLAQNASIFTGLADVRKEVQEVNAKVDIMASRLNAVQKDAEATKEALSHQLLEFQSQAQENHNVIHAQLSELVDYIHRGSADKKGESGSRGLQQPSSVQIEGSAVRPTFAQRVEMAQRHIVHTVLDADANRALLERQAAAERDRERRRR